MAHFKDARLSRPTTFNFAEDVIDYYASQSPSMQAMYWVSQDLRQRRSLTYQHFSRQSHRLASLLQSLGVGKGERVLMILPRIPEWWEIALGCLRSGVIMCPATTLLVDKDIEFRCQQTTCSVFIGNADSVGKFMNIRKHCPQVRKVIQVDGSPAQDVSSFHEELEKVSDDVVFRRKVPNKAEDPALIYFTSGTSGPPKMVQHSAISYPLAHTITGKFWLQLAPGKLYWNLSEQGWAKAAWSFFGAWNCGAALFIHNDQQPFSATRMLDVLHEFPITTLCAPPTAYRQLVLEENQQYLKKISPKALSHCTGAGEPLNDEVIRLWHSMTGLEIYDGYGQTETILLCGNFAGTAIRPGSMGKPSPGVPLAVVDKNGNESPVGEEGDIGLLLNTGKRNQNKFFGIFDGYLAKDGSLERRIRSFPSQEETAGKSWYLTGDRATRDNEGYFWFVGRSDDVINSAGYRIGPFEVESTLKQHGAVVESAVVSSPDKARGEVVKAFVVLTPKYAKRDEAELVEELQDWCKKRAAPYKYPRKIQFVDASFLPKTISGKIKRNELKKLEWRQQGTSKL